MHQSLHPIVATLECLCGQSSLSLSNLAAEGRVKRTIPPRTLEPENHIPPTSVPLIVQPQYETKPDVAFAAWN